ncbi:MAG TPA: hypothetical protein VJ672_05850 [Gemmatimonadaceae bacterium]|nr:hypothetical protein [Gemmatimonadaceae bacterium]
MTGVALLGALAALSIPVTPASAQDIVARANSLLSAGRVFAAETLYYAAVRRTPRNPEARLALGKYLASRGALRVGAVLMEEARFFGGDAKMVAEHLVPVYERLGEYGALASLPGSPLAYPQRARAEWLREHPQAVTGPDSSSLQLLAGDSRTFGRVRLAIGKDTVVAILDPRASGLTLDTAWARRKSVRTFTVRGERDPHRMAGVVPSVQFGEITLSNVAVSFAPHRGSSSATLGFDLLARLAPTIDPQTGVLMVRKEGRVARGMEGTRVPTVVQAGGYWLLRGDRLLALNSADGWNLLQGKRWTLDAKRGAIVVQAL